MNKGVKRPVSEAVSLINLSNYREAELLKMSDEGGIGPVYYHTPEWLQENSKFFLPPVCNKMMHNTQLKVPFIL